MFIETGNIWINWWYNIPLYYLVGAFWIKVFLFLGKFETNLVKRFKAHKHFKKNTEQYQKWGKSFNDAMEYSYQNYVKGNKEGGKAWEEIAEKYREKRMLCRNAFFRWWTIDERYWVF